MNIKQASDFTGISREMIRFYEKKGIIRPSRSENGYRDYSTHDLLLLVMARQYNCLGIDLNKIAQLVNEQDADSFLNELRSSVRQLQEESEWLAQKLNYARRMEMIFTMASESIEYTVISHEPFWYYPRVDFRYFASLYAYNSARPALRIRNEYLDLEEYPLEQGMKFLRPVQTNLPEYAYEKGTFFMFVNRIEPDIRITGEVIRPMIRIIEKEGYRVSGDAFAFLVMGDVSSRAADLGCFEFEVEKA